MNRAWRAGFTFVEMMMATAMIAMVSVALFAMVGNGIRIWQRTSGGGNVIDAHLFVERLEEDCANLVALNGYSMKTDGVSLQFYSVAHAAGTNTLRRVAWVEYRFDPKTGTIVRRQQDYPLRSAAMTTSRVMLESVAACTFSVFYDAPQAKRSFWSDEWPREDAALLPVLPRQVRVAWELTAPEQAQKSQPFIYCVPLQVQG